MIQMIQQWILDLAWEISLDIGKYISFGVFAWMTNAVLVRQQMFCNGDATEKRLEE